MNSLLHISKKSQLDTITYENRDNVQPIVSTHQKMSVASTSFKTDHHLSQALNSPPYIAADLTNATLYDDFDPGLVDTTVHEPISGFFGDLFLNNNESVESFDFQLISNPEKVTSSAQQVNSPSISIIFGNRKNADKPERQRRLAIFKQVLDSHKNASQEEIRTQLAKALDFSVERTKCTIRNWQGAKNVQIRELINDFKSRTSKPLTNISSRKRCREGALTSTPPNISWTESFRISTNDQVAAFDVPSIQNSRKQSSPPIYHLPTTAKEIVPPTVYAYEDRFDYDTFRQLLNGTFVNSNQIQEISDPIEILALQQQASSSLIGTGSQKQRRITHVLDRVSTFAETLKNHPDASRVKICSLASKEFGLSERWTKNVIRDWRKSNDPQTQKLILDYDSRKRRERKQR